MKKNNAESQYVGSISKSNSSSVSFSSNKIFAKIGKAVKLIQDLKDCGCLNPDYSISLPKIILVGPPTSGKSSIIESLIGLDFLPKGSNNSCTFTTRRPIEINLIHVPNSNKISPYAEIRNEDLGSDSNKFSDFKQLQLKLEELIIKKCGSEKENIIVDPIRLSIYSNSNPDLTIIDLPGVEIQKDTLSSNKISKEILFKYIKDENSIILYTINIDQSNFSLSLLKNNAIMSVIKEVDSVFNRTLGIFTKIDHVPHVTSHNNDSDPINIVKKIITKDLKDHNPEYHFLKNGFLALKNRNMTLTSISSIEDNYLKEREFFSSHPVLRFLSLPENFTIESLTEKLKKLFYENSNVRKNLVAMHKSLKDKIQECQLELLKYGTDYIGYTNDTKNTYATSLLNNFCEMVERVFSAKMPTLQDNATSHKLKEIYSEFLKNYSKNRYTPASNIKNEEIIKIIKLTEGDRLSGFPESEVIYSLLENELENLRDLVASYLESINDLVRECIKNCITRIFCRFPKMMDRVEEIVTIFLEKNFEKLKYLVESVSEMNFNYLYIDEKSLSYNELLKKFVLSEESGDSNLDQHPPRDRSNTSAHRHSERIDRPRPESFQDKDHYYNGLAEYVKILINYFYGLMVRNLRENIPKATGHFFINSFKQSLRFSLLNEITKEFAYESFLEEDPEIANRRNFFLDLMKVLKNCEKTLQYDEEIKFAIKGDNSKSIENIMETNFNRQAKMQNSISNKDKEVNLDSSYHSQSSQSNTNISFSQHQAQTNPPSTSQDSNKLNFPVNLEKRPSQQPVVNSIPKREEIKVNNDKVISHNRNMSNTSNTVNTVSQASQQQKPSISSTLDDKKQKEPTISIKMDPNSSDLKDMKVNINMDAETAYKLYQNNKQHLPTGQQMLNGVKATANFVEKNSGVIQGSEAPIVTGVKPQPKKNLFDPLSNLFGIGKKETKPSTTNTSNATDTSKKGLF